MPRCHYHGDVRYPSTSPLLALGILVVLGGPAYAVSVEDFQEGSFTNAGGTLPYRLFVPTAASNTNPLPLIVFLHGSGERGSDNSRQVTGQDGFLAFVDESVQATLPTFLVAPQLPAGLNWIARAETVLGLIDDLQQQYDIDPDRIVITGLSLGGEGTFELLARAPERFAAAIPMSGFYLNPSAIDGALPPVWVFHAADDPIVPVAGSSVAVAQLDSQSATYLYTEYPTGGHIIWDEAYATAELVEWTYAQRRGQPAMGTPNIELTGASAGVVTTTQSSLDIAGLITLPGSVTSLEWRLGAGEWMPLSAGTVFSVRQVELSMGDNTVRFRATNNADTTIARTFTLRRQAAPPGDGGDDGSGCSATGARQTEVWWLAAGLAWGVWSRRQTTT